jgi:hypothetical protein
MENAERRKGEEIIQGEKAGKGKKDPEKESWI